MHPIILASQSPRRKQLLEWAEIPFEIKVIETDESYPSNLSPKETAIHIAKNKGKAILNINPLNQSLILSADTIVVLKNKIIGKPKNRLDAINILTKLSGKTHSVITGVVILFKNKEISFAEITKVTFLDLTKNQIIYYIDKYNPFDKAGAYAIQEWIGVVGIKEIKGDFYNVMGLPVSKVVKIIKSLHNDN